MNMNLNTKAVATTLYKQISPITRRDLHVTAFTWGEENHQPFIQTDVTLQNETYYVRVLLNNDTTYTLKLLNFDNEGVIREMPQILPHHLNDSVRILCGYY